MTTITKSSAIGVVLGFALGAFITKSKLQLRRIILREQQAT